MHDSGIGGRGGFSRDPYNREPIGSAVFCGVLIRGFEFRVQGLQGLGGGFPAPEYRGGMVDRFKTSLRLQSFTLLVHRVSRVVSVSKPRISPIGVQGLGCV